MAFAKIKTEKMGKDRNYILSSIIGLLLAANFTTICLLIDSKGIYAETVETSKDVIKELVEEKHTLMEENRVLLKSLDYGISSSSVIGANRESLSKTIQKSVSNRGEEENNSMNIDKMDAMRALKSAENRVLDEYIRITALVLATMDTETGFKHITNTNPNGTKDYGIMQVNDAIIPEVKDALGENINPVSSETDNVESGSWEIYDCYVLAKDKHPEDVIWWTYAYYNRGKYFENKDYWKNPKHPEYKAMREQADVRSKKFKEDYEFYYNTLIEEVR